MALTEDAASVLEEFVQNVANLPAEIAHLLEEIQAKDRIVQECRSGAASRDASIQKFLKANGAGQENPKDEPYAKAILAHYDKAQVFQEEKVGLSERAAVLLDRQIKRLDLKIRDLQNEGSIAIDPQLPSLLNSTSALSARLPPLSTGGSTTTPHHPLSINTTANPGPSTTIANNPLTRLVQPGHHARQPSPLTTTAPINATSALAPPSSRATRSPSTDPSKRRRLNASHLAIPSTSSSLRQSSLGPNTPKNAASAAAAAAHQPSSSRGNSAGPRPQSTIAASAGAQKTATGNKPARPLPHQRIGHLNPSAGGGGASGPKAKKRSRPGKRNKASAGSDAGGDSESMLSEMDAADAMDLDGAGDADGGSGGGGGGEGDEEEGEGDDRKYCTCQRVSFGDMVACDNEECPYEWFHWACVGVKEEPKGAWFCEECRAKLGK